jgi:hypothetical protein
VLTAQGRPVRVDPLPGTDFGVAYLSVSPTVSGPATGSMVAGIGSVLVALVVICFGVTGARSTNGTGGGWGPLVSGAFAILAVLLGAGALAVGLLTRRQIRRSSGRLSGGGLAVTGIACGASGLGVAVLGVLLAVALS